MNTGQLTKNGISAYDSGGGGGSSKNMAMLIVGMQGNVEASEVDYLCDGVDDHIQINQAIQDATPGTTILILQGVYKLGSHINLNKSDISIRGIPLVLDKDYDYKANLDSFTSLTPMDNVNTYHIYTIQNSNLYNINISNLITVSTTRGSISLSDVFDININNVVFIDEYLTSSSLMKLYVRAYKNIHVHNCLFKESEYAQSNSLQIVSSSDRADNIKISNNIFSNPTDKYCTVTLRPIGNSYIVNNKFINLQLNSDMEKCYIMNNTFLKNSTCNRDMIDSSFGLINNTFISNNTFNGAMDKLDSDVYTYTGRAIEFQTTARNNIITNNIIKNIDTGINADCESVIVSGNNIQGSDIGILCGENNILCSSNIINNYKERAIEATGENIIVTSNNTSVDTDFTVPSTSYAIWTSEYKQLISDNLCSFKDAWVSNAYSLYIRSAYSLVSYNNIFGKNYSGSGTSITYSNNKYN